MAAPAPSQRPQSAGAGPSATWARSGEPGSAFSGLGRGKGRGSGRGRGGRGGRGAARESKPIGGDSISDKANPTSKSASTPAMKPVALSPPATNNKPSVSTNAPGSARSKGNPRRASRTIPPVVVPQLTGATDAPSSPSTSRPPNRRRRSQSGRGALSALPKINVPAHDDNLLRPQRYRPGPVPHTAPIKDTPPHLPGGTFDIRNNIDALVERVRAVAMADNRPSTPGSHIDWAGDDDDSLPDLDDWGVTTTASVSGKTDTISPIVVDGLKTLPDVNVEPQTSPSDIATEPISGDQLVLKDTLRTSEQGKASIASVDSCHTADASVAPITMTQQALLSAPASAKVSLHPSLPAKPVVTADMSSILPHSRQGPGATSMRKNSIPTSSAVTEKSVPAASQQTAEPADAIPQPALVIEKPATEQGLAGPVHSLAQDASKEDPFANLLARDGLVASIHAPAPGEISETKSAPSNVTTCSSTTTEYRTHTRAHTVGRPIPRPDHNGRPSRSGYNSPRGGLSAGGGSYHSRTHSTPPSGLHNHRSPAHRPVITGDAISRLARTIGNTTITSGRTTTIVTAAHD
ncbi:hypothetical protein D9615_000209 [Tricholomella constricta]|uniref:Uncharacterized protein n=1 Tax=Tricholomella constricta TaxID=117010 RepID=A0A8H5HRF9_9AGAR|nr:hypothetical protein D9615_000209 [Tricholomella constricta]